MISAVSLREQSAIVDLLHVLLGNVFVFMSIFSCIYKYFSFLCFLFVFVLIFILNLCFCIFYDFNLKTIVFYTTHQTLTTLRNLWSLDICQHLLPVLEELVASNEEEFVLLLMTRLNKFYWNLI